VKPKSIKHKIVYRSRVYGEKAYKFIALILPYLIIKKRQGELALKMYRFTGPHYKGNRKITEKERKERYRMYMKMKKFNKRGR